jgi:uncharacterized protein (DUF1501 family)
MSKMKQRKLSRRRFLAHSGHLAAVTAGSTLFTLGAARQAAAATPADYKALVCILLAGGNDSFNMLLPNDADQYAEYQNLRSDLALPSSDLLALPGQTASGRNYALHPGMARLQTLYSDGDAALIANVGTLLEPVDAAAIESGSAQLPLGLFSHSDQIAQWQTALPQSRVAEGWGGRLADLYLSQNPDPPGGISMNISLSGSNVFQSGRTVVEYSITAEGNGAAGINAYDDGTGYGDFRKRMVDELLAVSQQNIFRREYANRLKRAVDAQAVFVEAIQTAPALTTSFSDNNFSASLRQIARTIGSSQALDAHRQTFFITVGGWDHHDEVLENQAAMLPMISNGLSEFRDALAELGVFDQVATFTISDFARTLTSNGKGSDHGWGGHHIVMGGPVRGGQIYGDYPLLSTNSPLDVGRGVYAPTTPIDSYFAELALWFGVAPGDLTLVLPNITRFYSPGSSTPPLGFLL